MQALYQLSCTKPGFFPWLLGTGFKEAVYWLSYNFPSPPRGSGFQGHNQLCKGFEKISQNQKAQSPRYNCFHESLCINKPQTLLCQYWRLHQSFCSSCFSPRVLPFRHSSSNPEKVHLYFCSICILLIL